MQGNRQRIIVIAVSLLGMIVLQGYSFHLDAEEIALVEAQNHMGETVKVSGNIVDLTIGDGSAQLTVREGNASLRVFIDGKPDPGVQVGDRIEILGEVIAFKDQCAISCSDVSSIKTLEEWEDSVVTIPGLSADPWTYRDRNVNLSCRIAYPLSDRDGYGYAVVEDQFLGNYSIPIFVYGISVQRLYAGAPAYVNARFEYLRTSLGFGLIIDSDEHHIWSSDIHHTWTS